MIADTEKDILYLRDHYYSIIHISRFLKEKAKRVAVSTFTNKLEITAFKNPDGLLVVVIFNPSDEEIAFNLLIKRNFIEIESPSHSIMSILFQ